MISLVARVGLALTMSGFAAVLLYAVVFVRPEHYLDFLAIASPIVFFLSVPIGGCVYTALAKAGVKLTLYVCLIVGALLGATPGIILWLIAESPSPIYPMPEDLAAENARLPLLLALFGTFGGLVMTIVARVLRLR